MRDLLRIITVIMAIVWTIRSIRATRRHTEFEIPQQLVYLIRQAHAGEPFQTIWDIRVSDELRAALQAPLSAEQISAMSEESAENFRKSVTCYVSSHKLKGKSLTGVVNVSIDIESYSGKYDYHVSDVKLRLVVERIGDRVNGKWTLCSVEQIQ